MSSESWPKEWTDELRRLRAEGLSNSQIAEVLNRKFRAGVSRSAVIGKALRLGLPSLTKPSTQAIVASPELNQSHSKPFTFKRVAEPARQIPLQAEPPDGPPAPICQPVTIEQLTRQTCRWPIDPTGEHGWRYCGAPRDPRHRCYCRHHRWIEMQPHGRRRNVA